MGSGTASVSYRDLFGVREYRAILLAHVASMLGTWIGGLAVTVLVYQRTQSPTLTAAAFSLTFLPHLVGGAFAGVVMDRFRPRQVLVVCNVASAVLVGLLALPNVPVAVIIPVMFVVGMLAPVFVGLRSAILPDILGGGRLFVLGRGAIRLVSQSSQIFGYLLGGALLVFLSPQGALAVNAACFAVAAALLRFGTKERARPGRAASDTSRKRITLRDVLAHGRTRQLLFIGWAAPCFAIAADALAAPYVAGLGRPERDLALMLSAGAAGMVLADLVCSRLARPSLQRRLVRPGAVMLCLPLVVFAAEPGLPMAIVLMFVSGLGLAYNAGLDGLLVERAPEALLPKALAYQYVLLLGLQGLAVVGWGLLGEFLPVGQVIALAGGVGALLVLLLTWRLRPREVEVAGPPTLAGTTAPAPSP